PQIRREGRTRARAVREHFAHPGNPLPRSARKFPPQPDPLPVPGARGRSTVTPSQGALVHTLFPWLCHGSFSFPPLRARKGVRRLTRADEERRRGADSRPAAPGVARPASLALDRTLPVLRMIPRVNLRRHEMGIAL